MSATNQVINCLDCNIKSDCFQMLETEELELTTKNKAQIKYKKGEIISKQGTFLTHILYVKSGSTKVYKETEKESNIIFDIIPNGALLGLSTLFSSNIAQFTVAALEETHICAIDRNIIEQLVEKNGKFAAQVITSINDQARLFNDRLTSITQKQMNGRVADALLYMANCLYKSDKFKMILSRKDLGDFTGMSMMSAVRTLQEFKKEGIIKDDKNIIEIVKKDRLEKISRNG